MRHRARGAAWRFAASDDGARWGFYLALLGAVVVLYVGGRNQWFIRDDWALLLTRDGLHLRTAGSTSGCSCPRTATG